jgi:4-hydroxy-tetrahydrodipicolinate reductase
VKISLFGYGKMGKMVARIAEARDHQVVRSLEEADVCIDFSVAGAVIDHVKMTCAAHVPIVIGTTGWDDNLPAVQKLVTESESAALYAPNFSIGIAFFRTLLKEARQLFSEYEAAGIEFHHLKKKDAPSGTAKAIADDLDLPAPFSSVRCGSLVGKHEVIFDSPVEIVTVTHETKNREGFALGAVQAAEWICDKEGWFSLDDMLHRSDYALR